jgi:hypothetical protein
MASIKLYVVHNCAGLFQNADGVMKLKKLQKLVSKELQECGVSKDKEELRATLMDKVINHRLTNLATLPAVSLIFFNLGASLGTTISQGISIFPWQNELIFLGKIKISWEIVVPKLALRAFFYWSDAYSFYCCLLQIASSSRFYVDGKNVRLVAKNEEES